MNRLSRIGGFFVAALAIASWVELVRAEVFLVNGTGPFRSALKSAVDGDEIWLQPGVYPGGFFAQNLTGVTIRSANVNNPAVIDAASAGEGIKLESASRVTISDLVIEHAGQNGINIDDGGFKALSTDITLRNIVVRNGGGHGIKFTGVDRFLIENVTMLDWGNGHAAFNLLGAHNGLLQNSLVQRTNTSGGFGIKVEAGSNNVTIRANRFVESGERAIQFGGGVNPATFRPQPAGDVAATDILAEGNVIVDKGAAASGIHAAVAYVNVAGTTFRNNLIYRPKTFVGRILKENNNPGFVDTQDGRFSDNIVIWNNGDFSPTQPFNSGSNTLPATFHFEANTWFNVTNPSNSTVTLPTAETDGVYGINPDLGPDSVIPWQFDWGIWLVNATAAAKSFDLGDAATSLLLATPNEGGVLDTGLANPLIGNWSFTTLSSSLVELNPFSYAVFLRQTPGDYNLNGIVDTSDYTVWRDTLGSTNELRADGDRSGTVTLADYDFWKMNFGATEGAPASTQSPETSTNVAEPSTTVPVVTLLLLLSFVGRSRADRRGSWCGLSE